MANNENTVQIQVEVLRAQLDKLIADINSLKNQKISVKVDTAGAAALEQLSDAVQQMRTGLQELDAQLGQNAAAFSGMGNSAQAAVQALLQYISQVNQAASAEMQALAVRRQTTAATEEQASAAGTAAQAVSQMADAQRQESDADAQFLARLTAGNSALEDRAGQIRQLIDLYAQMQRIRASSAAGQSVPMLEAGDYEVFGQGTSHGPTAAQGPVIDVDWTDAARGAREYAGAASDAADATEQAVTQSDGLVDSFGRLFPQLTVWQLTRDAVNALVQELKAALETMKDVDTELTAIQKVTNNTDAQMSKIGEHGYDVASKYGVSVTDYLSSVGSFSKAGYKEMSEDMAELATKTQLVGDVNADTANKFLLSADAAFKLEGNVAALSKVLDAANTIENEYATEIQKIAEGFPLVANVASMANMTAEQLTAALGTITAATQESGSMAARAMRALILNIMGDTETELEDGITWTKDEIESLSQILWTYSEDAMKAAQATGSIVNPMEAVAGLAKAYKEGVLTQAELAQFESDLGGKLRTNQLDALIQHYDMYLEMLDKVTTSAGSADREIGTMLDSWQSKANILDNKWTELVNHMIETESVKGGLETVTELVELLDTDLGHIILTLAAAETGVFAIAAAVKSFQQVGSVLQLGSLSPWLLGIGAAITGIVVAVQAAQKAYAAAHPSIDKLNQDWEENRSAIQKTKEALEEYTDMTGALGDVEVATYDANTAAAKLTKSLFDANGKLTEHAKKALTTNTALADLAKKELELQNAAATANYNNLIAQIQAVGSSAIITSQQIQQMIGLIPGMTSNTWSAENQEFNMRRLFNQQTGKNWKKDAEDYAQWSSQYLLKKSSEYYKKQQEEYKRQMEELSKYTSDYTGTSTDVGGSSTDANLEAHKQKVELLKSELTLLEKQNASEDSQKDKMRQIQQALHAQAQYLRSIGGSQADINALSAEWWEWQEKINGTLKSTDDLLNELQDVMADKLSDLSEQRQNELDEIDKQIESLKQEKETRDEQLTLEEKILAVQQAQAKLANAQNERTVRQFNARTGQWEWVADQKEVDSAQEALDEAKKDLEDFKANMAYEAALAELEAQKKTINERYDDLETAYKDFLKSIKEKTRGIGEILQDIWKNATPELRQIIQENAELFKQFGFDVSQLSAAVNDTAKKMYGISKNGDKYEIGSDKGLDFINNKPAGSTMTGGDGSTWTKNADGTVTIVDKDGVTYTVYPNGGSGGTEDSTGGSASGPKYSGTVFAKRLDGKGEDYKISSANGLYFLNNALAGEKLDGGDGSHWVKNEDGTTSITDKYGIAYKVYDQGGILRGMGGIKATMQDEGITPPDVTALLRKRLLKPIEDKTFGQNMDQIRWMMASNGTSANEVHNASYDSHNIGTMIAKQINCTINGMKVSPQEAHALTLEKLANIAHNLGNFS